MKDFVRRSHRTLAGLLAVTALLAGSAACGDSPLNPSDYGIEVTDLVAGSGTEVELGRGVTVYYTLWLHDETQPEGKGPLVESLQAPSQPLSRALGYGQVISGWDIGIPGMRVGGIRRLVIPPAQAYGSSSSDKIPANSTLVFEIELLGVY